MINAQIFITAIANKFSPELEGGLAYVTKIDEKLVDDCCYSTDTNAIPEKELLYSGLTQAISQIDETVAEFLEEEEIDVDEPQTISLEIISDNNAFLLELGRIIEGTSKSASHSVRLLSQYIRMFDNVRIQRQYNDHGCPDMYALKRLATRRMIEYRNAHDIPIYNAQNTPLSQFKARKKDKDKNDKS